jgi:hypothetical protein
MRNIQPINVWKDGQNVQASILRMEISFDNLETHAVFQYELINDLSEILVRGTSVITGSDYENWSNGGNSNDEAYGYVASSLNLVIV